MWTSLTLLLTAAAACSGMSMSLETRPKYIGCQTSDECGKQACCVIGMGRYSIPTCQPRQEVGERCRPLGEPVNTTLHYPDGVSVDLAGVYYITCPCMDGLTCGDDMECVDDVLTNHVDPQYDYSEENNFHY